MKRVIHIFGASGSGTSTLGRAVADSAGFLFLDTDDYYWLPAEPMYTLKRGIWTRRRTRSYPAPWWAGATP